MKYVLSILVIIVGIASAYAGGGGMLLLHVGQGSAGGTPPVLTNLRITNTGAFRTTNTGANRAVFP